MGTKTAADHVVQILERVPLFRSLSRPDLERIARLVRPRELAAGEYLFREGDPGDRFYAVFSGTMEVLRERPLGDHEPLGAIRAGEGFGESALLTDAPRATSVRAVDRTRLLSISRGDFERLLGGDSLTLRLLQGLARSHRPVDLGSGDVESEDAEEALRQFDRLVLRGLEPRATPQVEGFRIAGGTARGETVGGGALWDTLTTDDGRVLLALMDVKGKGLPSGYLIGVTRAVFREVGPAEPLDRVLPRLNTATFSNLFEGVDECVEAAVVEIAGDRVRWSCAGDQPGVLIRRDGTIQEIATHGPPLGILPSFVYDVTPIVLEPGDTFLALSEAPSGLVRGVAELVRDRGVGEPAEVSQLFQAALRQVQSGRSGAGIAFVVVRRRDRGSNLGPPRG